jgi:hypothetical protein
MFAGLAVFGFAGPFVGGEDDGEEAVGGFNSPRAVDDVGDLQGLGFHGQAGLFVQLSYRGLRDRRGHLFPRALKKRTPPARS